MIRVFLMVFIQTVAMVGGQVLLKLGMQDVGHLTFTWNSIFRQIVLNGWMWIAVVVLVAASLFWLYLLKVYPLSLIYPLTSVGFALSMLAGMLIFHESVDWVQWVGAGLIMVGCLCLVH